MGNEPIEFGSPERPEDAERAALEAQVEELNNRYLRTLADYQNSQRRAVANEREARQQGIASVVMNVLTVLDHFDLALAQDPEKASAETIIAGVRVIRDEMMKVLGNHGVLPILPAAGDVFEPGRHEAIMQRPAEGVVSGTISGVFQPGFVLEVSGGPARVIRPAKVSVAP